MNIIVCHCGSNEVHAPTNAQWWLQTCGIQGPYMMASYTGFTHGMHGFTHGMHGFTHGMHGFTHSPHPVWRFLGKFVKISRIIVTMEHVTLHGAAGHAGRDSTAQQARGTQHSRGRHGNTVFPVSPACPSMPQHAPACSSMPCPLREDLTLSQLCALYSLHLHRDPLLCGAVPAPPQGVALGLVLE